MAARILEREVKRQNMGGTKLRLWRDCSSGADCRSEWLKDRTRLLEKKNSRKCEAKKILAGS